MKIRILPLTKNFKAPTKSTSESAGFDIYMPEAGEVTNNDTIRIPLGFSSEIEKGYVALILPRSGVGAKFGLELNNTCGVIDSDYRGEWMAAIKTKNFNLFQWNKGERLLQFLLVPVPEVELEIVESLTDSERGTKGFGGSGK